MGFAGILRQSTAVDVLIGPFVDSTDGDTEETALTISQADVLLSKNGQTAAQKTDATACAHDADGFYNCELDATDTNTVGQLVLYVHEAGALAVRHDFQVVEEAIYDALWAASADGYDSNGRVDVGTWLGNAVTVGVGNRPAVDSEGISGSTAAADSVEANIGNLDAAVSGVETDTQNIQSRLPAALVTGRMSSDAVAISGSTDAADKLEAAAETMVVGTVDDATFSPTSSAFEAADITQATADHYIGRVIQWTSGALTGEARRITDYVLANSKGKFTVATMTDVPVDGDTFIVI